MTAKTQAPVKTETKLLNVDRSGILQRKCDCGKSASLTGQCSECNAKNLLQRRSTDSTEVAEVPPIVHEVLRSPGQAIDHETRLQMESRFNQDFAPVRIHTNAHASQSAAALDAQAYTHAEQIVFGAGRYAPHTPEGALLLAHELTHVLQQRSQPEVSPQSQPLQVGAANDTLEQEADRMADQVTRLPAGDRLLAHELTHVVQQSAGAHPIQRWANCKPARLSLQDCPPREPAETQRARNGPMVFLPSLKVPTTGDEGALIVNFDIGSAAIKRNLHEMLYWQQFLQTIAANRSQWRLLGFTDCQGSESRNQKLRQERATAVFNTLPPAIKPQIVLHQGAPIQDCLTENNTAADRTLNRSVALILETSFADMKAEEITACIPPTAQSSPGKRCKFYVYDSEEPTYLGKAWKTFAYAFAAPRPGAYVIPSGKRTEDMLKTMLDTYAAEDCGCTDEIQFWSHGSPGNGMSITGDGEFTVDSFKIAGLEQFGDGPTSMPGYRQWADKLSPKQRRLVLLRRTICDPDSEVYYRSCLAFQKKEGQEFAKASAQFWRSEVVGHTKLIGLTQPGKKTLKPCQEPYWSPKEGEQEEGKKGKEEFRHTKPR